MTWADFGIAVLAIYGALCLAALVIVSAALLWPRAYEAVIVLSCVAMMYARLALQWLGRRRRPYDPTDEAGA